MNASQEIHEPVRDIQRVLALVDGASWLAPALPFPPRTNEVADDYSFWKASQRIIV